MKTVIRMLKNEEIRTWCSEMVGLIGTFFNSIVSILHKTDIYHANVRRSI